ncbi:DUF4952 domain-containing protein [Pseudomonas sp. B21-053]|uniref:DUF4952 domain-containing protein n=1 Tax=Pseudomonas sp. B21-053 TaxID=2895493 RepID=UPI00222F3F4A|nr:DUF4952 domain-containing protein [Pseudomonas sp. B21-053]UZE14008.1 DUF4952 domain-containing protein [Pseudomonas sp. B21-053]
MKRPSLLRLLAALLMLFANGAKAELQCDDFLAKLSDKPGFIEFQGCQQSVDRQGQPFSASYRVSGENASKAEKYLKQQFGQPALKRVCCIWESTAHFYRDKQTDIGYSITMGSGETLIHDRKSWPAIDYFYIGVDAYAEDP